MSEEILRALMELFAIIIKQDGGISEKEKEYVRNFLIQQIGIESAEPYYALFLKKGAGKDSGESKKNLTSVLDSVKALHIGKKINKTLDQRQKVIVLVRCIELINTEYNFTDQRLSLVKTLAEVFKIEDAEYRSIIHFMQAADTKDFSNSNILTISGKNQHLESSQQISAEGLDREITVLRIPSVELYFLKYGGKNEILLNGHPLQSGNVYLLANGSSLRTPMGTPVYYSDITAEFLHSRNKVKILLEAENISYDFPGKVAGLDSISLEAGQGNLIGILGASGSGKTTLLNVLSGILKPSDGRVLINHLSLFDEPGKLKGVIGHVPQDDLLVEELTVFENLWYNARFCFANQTAEEIRERVENTLKALGLFEKKDLKVGSVMRKTISGGQRKRLNIALELIREPSILFLDEPTSGLSSRDSENVMDLLRELTIKGKLIFLVIHQPSSELFKLFDQVVILDEGGKMVYYGNPVEAVIYFRKIDNQVNSEKGECPTCGNMNPEQIFNIIEARQVDEFGNYTDRRKISPQRWQKLFEKEKQPDKNRDEVFEQPPKKLDIPSWSKQVLNYLKRDFKSKIHNRQYMILVLGVSPLLALILSYIIRYIADPNSRVYIFRENENIPVYIFMAIIVALFLGLIMSAEEIFRDRKILKREQFLHLSRSAYLAGKLANIFLISAVQTIVFVLIANSILGIAGMNFQYWFALFSVAASANLIGLIISSAFHSAVTIYIIIPLVMIPMMVLSGAMFSFEKLNRTITSVNRVPVIAEAMPTRWAYEALMVMQFKDNRFEENFYETEREISRTNFQSAYYIPALQEKLTQLNEEYEDSGTIQENTETLEVLKNELLIQQDTLGRDEFTKEMFHPDAFNSELSSQISRFLSDLNNYYLKKFMLSNRMKQNQLNQIMKERREVYYSMLDKYHNESVADQVKKIYEKNKIIESDGRLYQQTDPIFLYPEAFRAHFYAPVKKIGNYYMDTYWFNIMIIWLISILLYILLYFDLLNKFVNSKIFAGSN